MVIFMVLSKNTWLNIADELGKEISKCAAKKVGAIIIKNESIVSSGINGTPSGFGNCNEYFHRESSDSKWHIDYKNLYKDFPGLIVYENLPTSVSISEDGFKEASLSLQDLHHKWSDKYEVHAEMNAILKAGQNGIGLDGTDIYINYAPCFNCSKSIIVSGIKRVFYKNDYDDVHDVKKYLMKNGVHIEKIL